MLDIPNLADRVRPGPGLPHRASVRTDVAVARLQVLSDLHLDGGSTPLPRPVPGVDAVVVAGDTAAGSSVAFAFLRAAFPSPIPLVVVLGNREFHGRYLGRERQAARSLAALHGIVLLDDGVADVAGLRFVGATLWTDYCLGGAAAQPDTMFGAASSIGDHARISLLREPWLRFRPYDSLAQHHATRRFLAREVGAVPERTTVVVTHHAPSPRSLRRGAGPRPLDGCFASDLEDLVALSGAALWVHGHVHSRCDYMLGSTRVVCNPKGHRCADFDPSFVVEVPVRHGRHGTPAGSTCGPGARSSWDALPTSMRGSRPPGCGRPDAIPTAAAADRDLPAAGDAVARAQNDDENSLQRVNGREKESRG